MLLELTTTAQPASDLGFLLEKHPERVQNYELAAGAKATVFYREVSERRCTAVLLLEVDPIGLARGRGISGGADVALQPYVNDRPYVASSMLSVALGVAFRSALAGRSRHRPELAATAIPIEVRMPTLPCRGGERLLRALFEPLGYSVEATRLPLDPAFPEWGASAYFAVELRCTQVLRDVLQHLYVLIPVLDDEKHYWVGDAEVEKLLRHGAEWLPQHPAKETIAQRYLKHRRSLAREALERLTQDDAGDEEEVGGLAGLDGASAPIPEAAQRERRLEDKLSLNQQRLDFVSGIVAQLGAQSVVDMGCGEGRLLSELLKLRALTRIVGLDVSMRALEHAQDRLHWDRLPERQRARLQLLHGSLIYRDARLAGFDIATVVEVIEHLDSPRLAAFERVLFEFARPLAVLVTTPNREYNALFPTLPAGQFRHGDHRFEWTRVEFQEWAARMAARFGYQVRFEGIGDLHEIHGSPTQAALFQRIEPVVALASDSGRAEAVGELRGY